MTTWGTFFVSIGVLVIAFIQWRTAHQKVVLDLFEKRWKVYQTIVSCTSTFTMLGDALDIDKLKEFYIAQSDAKFIFGSDVLNYLEELHTSINHLNTATKMVNSYSNGRMSERDYDKWLDRQNDRFDEVAIASKTLSELCQPYMLMNQKLIRTPVEWFHDKNKQRLSYGDNAK